MFLVYMCGLTIANCSQVFARCTVYVGKGFLTFDDASNEFITRMQDSES